MNDVSLSLPWWLAAGILAAAAGAAALLVSTHVYKHVICWKYLFCGWKAVVPLVAALPAALGVFLLILVFAIMDGFVEKTREMTRGTLSDVIVDASLGGLPYYDEFIERLGRVPGVEGATPVIQTFAVCRIAPPGSRLRLVRPCVLIGIRPAEKARMGRFLEYLQRRQDYSAADAGGVLEVPEVMREARREHALPDRPSAIAGTGLVGRPVTKLATDRLPLWIGWRMVCRILAGPAVLALVLVWNGRRRPGSRGWQAVMALLGVLALVLAVWGLGAVVLDPVSGTLPTAAVACLVAVAVSGVWSGRRGWAVSASAVAGLAAYRGLGLVFVFLADEWGERWLGVGRAVTAWVPAASLVGAIIAAHYAGRKGDARQGWRVALSMSGLLALVLVGGGALLEVVCWGKTEPVMWTKVVDEPLLEYGQDLVVGTVPVRASGGFDLEPGGVPKVQYQALTLVDTFKSGYWESDSTHLYVPFEVAQRLAGMEGRPAEGREPAVPARASQVQVRLAPGAEADAVVEAVERAWLDFITARRPEDFVLPVVNTWQTQQRTILGVVEMERNITALMLGAMLIGFGILTALISYVMAYIKSRDVGILKALGAGDAGVGSLFLGYGFVIGLVGTAAGLAAALLMVHYLDPIETYVNQFMGRPVFPRDVYYFDRIPRTLSAAWAAGVGLSVLALSTLASTAGGLLAALKQPVETLRYE